MTEEDTVREFEFGGTVTGIRKSKDASLKIAARFFSKPGLTRVRRISTVSAFSAPATSFFYDHVQYKRKIQTALFSALEHFKIPSASYY